MKVGHASYGCYGDYIDFLAVGKYVYIIDHDFGFIGFVTTKEEAFKLLSALGNYNKDDIYEVYGIAVNNMKDEKPYTE